MTYLGLEGKRALVTGGTKGAGEAIVSVLREAGARVLTTARSRPRSLTQAEDFIAADVSSAEGCARVAQAVRERLDGIDIVVHVVGGSSAPAGGLARAGGEEWPKGPDQKLFAPVRPPRAPGPPLLAPGSGASIH